MSANVPEVFVLDDTDHQSVIKITGYYTAACTTNNTIVTANTLKGANTSLPCILSITALEYTSSIANGHVDVEFVSTVNANSKAITVGRANDGQWNRYIPNSANTASGDINLNQIGLSSGDSFTLIITCLKEFRGVYWDNTGRGSGAWANTQIGY